MSARTQIRLTASDRRQQILDIATGLFAEKGFKGVTTREIAHRARVNEALVFRHFPTKEDLYWGVLEMQSRERKSRESLNHRLAEISDARELFIAVAEDMLSRDVTLSRLLWFSALENHRLSGKFYKTHISKYFEELAGHIRKRIAAGEFRPVDPMLAARGFIGMVGHYFLVQELFGAKRFQQFDRRKVSETLTEIWLTGVTQGRLSKNGENGRA